MRIPGIPRPYTRASSGRDRDTGAMRRFYIQPYKGWRQMAAEAVAYQRRGVCHEEPVIVTLVVTSTGVEVDITPAVGGTRPKGVYGDLDNYVTAVLDAAEEGGWIENDRLVVGIDARFGE